MILRNTIKLGFANISNIWKLLLYRFLCLLCVLGLTTVIAWPIINVLIKDNFFINLQKSFEEMIFNINFEKLFLTIDKVFKNFAEIISNHGLVVQSIVYLIFVVVLISFLEEYASLSIHDCIGGYMSSLTKYSFTNCYVSNFGKSTLLALSKIITSLPINLIIWFGSYFLASTLYAKIGVFAIILAFFLLIVFVSLKHTIFCGWKPAYLIHDEKVFVSLKRGVKMVSKRFFRTFSGFLILILSLFIINIFALTLTVGVGLLVTLPLSTLLVAIFEQVVYRELLGMRYYIDADHIISPKKLEQQDRFSKMKDII